MFIALNRHDTSQSGAGETLDEALRNLQENSETPMDETDFYEATKIEVQVVKKTSTSLTQKKPK